MTGPKALYSRSQRKVISATVITGGELPYSLCQVRYFAGYYLSALKRLSIRHSERNRLGLDEEEVVWIRYLLFETSWNSLSSGTHLFASTLSISKRHLIACTERVYGRSFKHMDYHPRLSTLSRCSTTTSSVVSSLETTTSTKTNKILYFTPWLLQYLYKLKYRYMLMGCWLPEIT